MRPAGGRRARPRPRRLVHDGVGGEVAGAAEVLEQSAAQQVLVEQAIGMAQRALLPRRGTIVPHCGTSCRAASSTRASRRHRRADAARSRRRAAPRLRPAPAGSAGGGAATRRWRIVRARVAAAALAPRQRRAPRPGGRRSSRLRSSPARSSELALDRARCRRARARGRRRRARGRRGPTSTRAAGVAARRGESSLQRAGDAHAARRARAVAASAGAGAAPIAARASAAATLPNTTASSSELRASRLAPCAPVADTSPQAHRPGERGAAVARPPRRRPCGSARPASPGSARRAGSMPARGSARRRSGSAAAKRSPTAARASRKTAMAGALAPKIARATTSRGASSASRCTSSRKRAPVSSISTAPSPRSASVSSGSGSRPAASAVGWNCTNSRSTRRAPARAAIARPSPVSLAADWWCSGRAGRRRRWRGPPRGAAMRSRGRPPPGSTMTPATRPPSTTSSLGEDPLADLRPPGCGATAADERAHHLRAGGVAAGVEDAAAAVRRPRGRARARRRRAVEARRRAPTRRSISPGARSVSSPTIAGSSSPPPTASVSSACRRGESSRPSAAATPPCAQGLDPPTPSMVLVTSSHPQRRERERRAQPGHAGAEHDDVRASCLHLAPSVRRRRGRCHAGVGSSPTVTPGTWRSSRASARPRDAARAATSGSISMRAVMVSSERRILGSVIRFMCGQRLHGRTNSTSG